MLLQAAVLQLYLVHGINVLVLSFFLITVDQFAVCEYVLFEYCGASLQAVFSKWLSLFLYCLISKWVDLVNVSNTGLLQY